MTVLRRLKKFVQKVPPWLRWFILVVISILTLLTTWYFPREQMRIAKEASLTSQPGMLQPSKMIAAELVVNKAANSLLGFRGGTNLGEVVPVSSLDVRARCSFYLRNVSNVAVQVLLAAAKESYSDRWELWTEMPHYIARFSQFYDPAITIIGHTIEPGDSMLVSLLHPLIKADSMGNTGGHFLFVYESMPFRRLAMTYVWSTFWFEILPTKYRVKNDRLDLIVTKNFKTTIRDYEYALLDENEARRFNSLLLQASSSDTAKLIDEIRQIMSVRVKK